jgi:hypothetical protein
MSTDIVSDLFTCTDLVSFLITGMTHGQTGVWNIIVQALVSAGKVERAVMTGFSKRQF